MNELALFAGAGGGLLGAKLLGWRTVCAVEVDAGARRILLARQRDGCLPPFPIWDDVRTFDGRPWRGYVDVVSGGFPCTDIAICKPRPAGIAGRASGLWSEMARVIGEVRPRFALVENSPMLVGRGLTRVLGDLAALGFDARWGCLGGHHVGGIAHGARLWIVAYEADGEQREGLELHADFEPGEEGSWRRQFDGAVGAMLRQDDYSRLKRNAHAVASGMDRLRCIGNGQVPAVVRLAWNLLCPGHNQ